MAVYKKVRYEVSGGIARIALNRPDKRNALDAEIISNLTDALGEAAADSAVRVVVLSGAGKDFCSGADLSELRASLDNGPLENLAGARNLAGLFLAMRNHRCPIVALVKGRALAGGCGLASACDIVLAEERAQFGYPEINIGFIPAMVMAILRRTMPEKRAFEWIVSGEAMPARAAQAAGLVNQVFPDSEFDASAESYIAKLAAKPASAMSLSKRLLYHMDAISFEAALEAGVQANAIARMTGGCRTGVEKFLRKQADKKN